eukprot:TRINITY_DN67_c0_g2_i1.p1 TRINITY_DN67_c0_g2~~TRINITY_DN67_c0_g2_i1.p1  ORF type:complete len:537 (+),score=146.30 TRINITY_DN67_c0_g2_i1:34-1611(+)
MGNNQSNDLEDEPLAGGAERLSPYHPSMLATYATVFFQSMNLTIVLPTLLWYFYDLSGELPSSSSGSWSSSALILNSSSSSFSSSSSSSVHFPISSSSSSLLQYSSSSSTHLDPAAILYADAASNSSALFSNSSSMSSDEQFKTSDQWMYGLDVAAYAGGQLVGVTVFAFWAAKQGNKKSIIGGCIMVLFGCVLYVLLPLIPGQPYAPHILMFVARFISGIGAGNITPCRAYAAEATEKRHRNAAFGYLNAAQGVGMLVAPLLGILFLKVDVWIGPFLLNQNTWPGYFGLVTDVINIVVLFFFFKELPLDKKQERKQIILNVPVVTLILVYTIVFYVLSVFECLGTVITHYYFGWTSMQNGLLLGAVGIMSVVVFAVLSVPVLRRVDERLLMMVGLSLLLGCTLFMCCWYPLQKKDAMWQFAIGALLLATAYPICLNEVMTIYSKIVPPNLVRQQMGWMGMMGCVARFVGPVLATLEWDIPAGINGMAVFLTGGGLVVISMIAIACIWRQLNTRVPSTPMGSTNL